MIRRWEEDAREIAESLDDIRNLWEGIAKVQEAEGEVKARMIRVIEKVRILWDAVSSEYSDYFTSRAIEESEKSIDRLIGEAVRMQANIYKMQEYLQAKEELVSNKKNPRTEVEITAEYDL